MAINLATSTSKAHGAARPDHCNCSNILKAGKHRSGFILIARDALQHWQIAKVVSISTPPLAWLDWKTIVFERKCSNDEHKPNDAHRCGRRTHRCM